LAIFELTRRKNKIKMSVVKKAPEHPKYIEMVKAAIVATADKKGASRQSIVKYILANFKVSDNANVHIKLALKKGVSANVLVQPKGTGASGSFKLNKEAEAASKKAASKKLKVAAKKVAPKKAAAKKSKKVTTPAKKAAKSTPKKSPKKVAAKKPAAKKVAAKRTPAKKPVVAAKAAKKPVAKKVAAKKPAAKRTPAKKTAAKK
jgi:histone H1/5